MEKVTINQTFDSLTITIGNNVALHIECGMTLSQAFSADLIDTLILYIVQRAVNNG